ncbi:hypothetical protein L6452_14459 [Arctium lappa]|uniref:Uncharacterized protein n=1 Tax=Arctium lappa TaxID=4217 RepID=A0ACB9CL05_ARCLA|nr:hypothetical protein L6452_14459 [Arctium lappa]
MVARICSSRDSSEIVADIDLAKEKLPEKNLGGSKRSLAECISTSEDEEWSALEGAARVNSLLSIPSKGGVKQSNVQAVQATRNRGGLTVRFSSVVSSSRRVVYGLWLEKQINRRKRMKASISEERYGRRRARRECQKAWARVG